MRIVVSEFISLDGVVQAPGGKKEDTDGGFEHGGWSMRFFDPETMGGAFDEMTNTTDALLYGRRTWQVMASAWPGRAGDPFADWINQVPKHVASRTLTENDLEWTNSKLLPPDDVIGAVERLRAEPGGDIGVMGSASLVTQLVGANLVDEYRLMIEPVILGGGKSIFPSDGKARPLELVSTTTSNTGVHVCTYRVLADAGRG
jgi:dihydrofolate reductase